MERIFITPKFKSGVSDAVLIQEAVEEAKKSKINVLFISRKLSGENWLLTSPIRLPDYFTVIISNCTIESEGTVFVNENYDNSTTLKTEAHKIFILGRKGAILKSKSDYPQIVINNARDCRIAGVNFIGGGGVSLTHVRYSKIQMLTFKDSKNALSYFEGCNNIITESVDAATKEEAFVVLGGKSRVLVKEPEIFSSIFCRMKVKTLGAPAFKLRAGESDLYNIVIRDLTDETSSEGYSLIIGDKFDSGKISDVTVRGVNSLRSAVITKSETDGSFYSNIRCAQGLLPLFKEQNNTRDFYEEERMEIVLPQFREELPDREFVTPNSAEFFGKGDAESVQNAVNYASRKGINCVVIPSFNLRTKTNEWVFEKAVKIPSYMTVVFLHSFIKHKDFMYENLFINSLAYDSVDRSISKEEHDITLMGVGDAVLSGGKHNGLKEKTCFLYGLPDKRPNATVLFNNVRNMVLENFQIHDSRWYGTYFIHCDTVRISGIDFDNGEDYCNRDGVDMRQGNHNFLVENITGVTGDDTVALNNLGNDGNDGRYVEGKDCDTLNVVIRNIKSDAGRWFNVRLLCQDRHLEQNFILDTIMDVSRPDSKKRCDATVVIGSHEYHYKIPAEIGDLAHITVRDVYTRGVHGVAFGGFSDDVKISNVHAYNDACVALTARITASVRDIEVSGIFYKCLSENPDSDLTVRVDRPFNAIHFNNFKTETPLKIKNVFVSGAKRSVYVGGKCEVEIENLYEDNTKDSPFASKESTLFIDGKRIES